MEDFVVPVWLKLSATNWRLISPEDGICVAQVVKVGHWWYGEVGNGRLLFQIPRRWLLSRAQADTGAEYLRRAGIRAEVKLHFFRTKV